MESNNKPQIRFKGFTDDWEQRKLGDMVEFFSGLTYSPDNVIKQPGTLVLRSSNVQNGEIVNADNVYVDNEVVNSDNVQVGDIAVVVRNGSRSLIGKHAAIKYPMKDTVIGAFMTGIRSDTPSFTNALLDTQQFETEIAKNLGATINQITTGNFKKMTFNFPEIDERLRIGDFFNQLDNTIALHQRKLELLKEQKKGFLQKMFPKKGEKIPEIRFKGFSEEWEEAKLGDYCGISRGTLPAKTSEVMGKYPFYNTGKKALQSNSYSIHTDASIIVSGHGSVGNIHFAKGRIGVSDGCYILDTNKLDIKFLYFTSKKYLSNHLNNKKTGTIISHTTKKDVESCKFYKPSLEEQEKIGLFFEGLEKTISLQENKLDIYKQFKKAMLQKMFV